MMSDVEPELWDYLERNYKNCKLLGRPVWDYFKDLGDWTEVNCKDTSTRGEECVGIPNQNSETATYQYHVDFDVAPKCTVNVDITIEYTLYYDYIVGEDPDLDVTETEMIPWGTKYTLDIDGESMDFASIRDIESELARRRIIWCDEDA